MTGIPDLETGRLDMTAGECIDTQAEVLTDALSAYSLVSQGLAKYTIFNLTKLEFNADILLPRVIIMISNAKRWIDDIFHHVNQKYLQNYLDEFFYKQNRRYFNE